MKLKRCLHQSSLLGSNGVRRNARFAVKNSNETESTLAAIPLGGLTDVKSMPEPQIHQVALSLHPHRYVAPTISVMSEGASSKQSASAAKKPVAYLGGLVIFIGFVLACCDNAV